MSRYGVSALAESDLDEIWWHVAQDASIERADRLIEDIVERFALLSRHPEAGRLRRDIGPSVRSFPVHSYIIYYTEVAARVLVARVLHSSRDQQTAFQEGR